MNSRHTQTYNVGDWSHTFNEESNHTFLHTVAEKVCEECKDTLHRRVADAATIEKLCGDFQTTLQTSFDCGSF